MKLRPSLRPLAGTPGSPQNLAAKDPRKKNKNKKINRKNNKLTSKTEVDTCSLLVSKLLLHYCKVNLCLSHLITHKEAADSRLHWRQLNSELISCVGFGCTRAS